MSFISVWYILFLLAAIVIFYVLPAKVRNLWLLIVSIAFYFSWHIKLSIILLFVTLVSWSAGLLLGKKTERRKTILAISLILCFAPLVYSKYLGFFAELLSVFGADFNIGKILMPIGISFFTLSAAGYCIDVYRGTQTAEHDLLTYALFISFFPLITSGPIERAKNILPQLRKKHQLQYENIKAGLFTILWGFFVKMVIADRLAMLVNSVFDNYQNMNGIACIIATLSITLQIYCDFYGYSLIAIGSARLFGIHVMDNFKTPCLSRSVRELWQRWHISLSTWLRDYLYFPLGGSRCSRLRKYLNIMIVFCVSGLWHGASLTFLLWGALNGLFQILEDLFDSILQKAGRYLPKQNNLFIHLIESAFTFILISIAFIFFRADSISQGLQIFTGSFTANLGQLSDGTLMNLGLDQADSIVLCVSLLIFLLVGLTIQKDSFASKLLQKPAAVHFIIYIFLLVTVLIFGIYGPAYDTQNFIYAQF